MNTTENNKIIANFMGHKINFGFKQDGVLFLGQHVGVEKLKYHSSWDWLMEVVEKIESLDYSVDIFNKAVSIQCNTKTQMIVDISGRTDNSKLSQVYEAVVEFIKYKN